VAKALIFIRVNCDPEGDGEEAGLYMTLIKVKSDFQNAIITSEQRSLIKYRPILHSTTGMKAT
jgi:hypothetical protein